MKFGKYIITPSIIWLIVFFLIPLLFIFKFAFMKNGMYGQIENVITFENITKVFDPLYLKVLWTTFWIAVVTTIITLLIAYPYAYTATVVSEKWQRMLLLLITIPFWINFLVRSYALIVIFRSKGIINTLLLKLGIINEPLQLLYNMPSVIMGMVYTLLPFMVLPIFVAIEQLDHRKLDAANDLGATPFQTFFHVTLPLTMKGIFAGSILVFVASFGMFVVSDVMGGSKVALIGNVIQNQFLGARNWPFGSALSIFLVISSIGLIGLYYLATKNIGAEKSGGEK
ncbi:MULTISPECIES: ABC transporter permease [Gottfriedia]|uniref:Spermidine/putrescine ABC transporter permease n=1 Tax=Gottfriedia solisilvae TaxID=1516104 RepID=A0A8J3AJ10_9BACI|nr:ABC transporter permease [Gottfriedia solisilvae]GGI14725.1 spermidine/putrescine ABC transporter permease [Gottfriedia solisilvae]